MFLVLFRMQPSGTRSQGSGSDANPSVAWCAQSRPQERLNHPTLTLQALTDFSARVDPGNLAMTTRETGCVGHAHLVTLPGKGEGQELKPDDALIAHHQTSDSTVTCDSGDLRSSVSKPQPSLAYGQIAKSLLCRDHVNKLAGNEVCHSHQRGGKPRVSARVAAQSLR